MRNSVLIFISCLGRDTEPVFQYQSYQSGKPAYLAAIKVQ